MAARGHPDDPVYSWSRHYQERSCGGVGGAGGGGGGAERGVGAAAAGGHHERRGAVHVSAEHGAHDHTDSCPYCGRSVYSYIPLLIVRASHKIPYPIKRESSPISPNKL